MTTSAGAATVDDRPVCAGDVCVRTIGAALLADRDAVLADAVADGLTAALVDKDPTLWGPEATPEASVRLGWLDLPISSRALLPRIQALREECTAEGLDRIVLCGMGGSSLAPEVITRTAGVALTVLDTTDPGQVRAVLAEGLDRTVLVVSSKSGGTVETDSHRRIFERAFADAGIDPAGRIVVVTDPGSPLEQIGRDAGYRAVFLADPHLGGRYSALSAFGLVPSGLAGVDVGTLLDDAAALQPALGRLVGNPGLALGATLGGAGIGGHDTVVLADTGSGLVGFGDWAEQLIAESTGKQGRGLLPVIVEGPDAPDFSPTADSQCVALAADRFGPAPDPGTVVRGPLGAQFLLWEYAIAVAGRAIGINPFDQPNVAESKANTTRILEARSDPSPEATEPTAPAFTDDAVEVYGEASLLSGADTVDGAVEALVRAVPLGGYLAVMTYLDRMADDEAARLRPALTQRLARPVTFGWGPRFLHSTGQYHKGGPASGAFLQLTGAVTDDLDVPGRDFSLGALQAAQAEGDLRALTDRARPLLRLHLLDRARGLAQVLAAARGNTGPGVTGSGG